MKLRQNGSCGDPWDKGKTAELNQPVHFKDTLTSEWKLEYMLYWGRSFAF